MASNLLLMQHEEEPLRRVHEEQLAIEVPATSTVDTARWTADDEFREYARQFGTEAAIEQRRAAERAQNCNCGEQVRADAQAKIDKRRPKKLLAHQHKSGCPAQRPLGKKTVRLRPEDFA